MTDIIVEITGVGGATNLTASVAPVVVDSTGTEVVCGESPTIVTCT